MDTKIERQQIVKISVTSRIWVTFDWDWPKVSGFTGHRP